ncbi:hypothetical protein P43SY_006083 [Pythium insidiosum]|uniref:Uncharacterized protein n=1 Tax=Pythium insidiosum TaxID=114742 RepID=A0AAD5LT58_PYTIN|nr:hypothetical protein P43SY_006083 [Pythium insidiosum]
MGDAEAAQFGALKEVPDFAKGMPLMCFFHVLYNVKKRIMHLPGKDKKLIMASIMDMHFSESPQEFFELQQEALKRWRKFHHLWGFADYFEEQWLRGDFARWQVYHTPARHSRSPGAYGISDVEFLKNPSALVKPTVTVVQPIAPIAHPTIEIIDLTGDDNAGAAASVDYEAQAFDSDDGGANEDGVYAYRTVVRWRYQNAVEGGKSDKKIS